MARLDPAFTCLLLTPFLQCSFSTTGLVTTPDLPHNDGCFVRAHLSDTTEAFLGGVPLSFLYDNSGLAAARSGDGRRQHNRDFTELRPHYVFDNVFGRLGKVRIENLAGLNACLERRCLARMDARLRAT